MPDQRDVPSLLTEDEFPPIDQIPINTGIPPTASAQGMQKSKETEFDLLAEAVRHSRRAERRDRLMTLLRIGLPILLGVAALAGLIWWMTTFDAVAWQILLGVIVGLLVAAGGVLLAIILEDEDDPLPLILFAVLTVVNGVLMIIFPGGYGIFGGVGAIGLAVALGALTLAMNDGLDPWGCGAAFGMAANILIATSLAGVTALWTVVFVVLLVLCAALFIPFADDDASIAAGVSMLVLLAVVFIGGRLVVPHYAHMLHQVPTASVREDMAVERVDAVCGCGEEVQIPSWLFNWLHSSHCETEEMACADEFFHYQTCSCGSIFGYENHEFEYVDGYRTGRCLDCGLVDGVGTDPEVLDPALVDQ